MSTNNLSGRHYSMARFGKCYFYTRRKATRNPKAKSIYRWRPGDPDPVGRIVDSDNLLNAFQRLAATGGPGAGPDGVTYRDLTKAEIAWALREASRLLRNGEYRPPEARTIRFAKASGGFRTLKLSTIVHRCICKATEMAIERPFNELLLPTVHGFRSGHSVLTLLAQLEQFAIQEDLWVIGTDDIANAFPSIPVNLAVSSIHRVLNCQSLTDFIELLIRGHDGPRRTLGLDQGDPISPIIMNTCLHYGLDLPYAGTSTNPPLWRFADNLVVAARTVADCQHALTCSKVLLRENGMRLKGIDGDPVDLRQPGTSATILGFQIRKDNDGLALDVTPEAWEELDHELKEAYSHSDATRKAWDVVRGWVASWGMTAVESVGPTTQRIHRLLAKNGFQEGPSGAELDQSIQASRASWESRRRAARADYADGRRHTPPSA